MKYRYVISRDDAKNKLIIKEFTRGVDEHLSMMGSREVDGSAIEDAIATGGMALVNILRDHGMYPPEPVAKDMAKLVTDLYGALREETNEGHVDEIDVITPEAPPKVEPEETDEEEIDSDLPDEDILESDDLELEPTKSDEIIKAEETTEEEKKEEEKKETTE